MELNANASLWIADAPVAWPDAPADMTVTTLREIESCTRRWALSAGQYPDLWNGRGYPPRVHLSALSGTVVHHALEVITRALVRAGCSSLHDPTALQVLRGLGGYTKVVNDCIDRTLSRLASNPRAQRVLEFAARTLRAQVPELRTRAQTMLSRVRLSRDPARHAEGSTPRARGPLTVARFPRLNFELQRSAGRARRTSLYCRRTSARSPTSRPAPPTRVTDSKSRSMLCCGTAMAT